MRKFFAPLSGLSIVLLLAACSSEQPATDDNGGGTGGTTQSGTGGSLTAGNASGGAAGSTAAGGRGAGQAGTTGAGNAAGVPAGGGSGNAPEAGSGGQGGTPSPAGGAPAGGAPAGGAPQGGGGSLNGGTAGVDPIGVSAGMPPAGGAGSGGSGGTPPVIVKPPVVTSAPNAYWQVGTVTEVTSGTADVTVNDTSVLQTFTGFGGTFNEKGWEALAVLTQEERDHALKLLFDAADGAKFVYGRIPIGASDYASNRYTLDDTAGNAADPTMTSFSIDRDKQKLIPYIKAALAVNPNIIFWGSPWTPPPWMKDNKAYDRGNMTDAALEPFALYLSKFVEEYGKEGIVLKAIHPQNEPGYAQDYPSCGWSSGQMTKFIGTILGPMFKDRGITAQIFMGTMSNSTADASLMKAVMSDGTAKSFVKGYGLEWGMLDVYSSLGLDKSLAIWQTEHKCGNYPWSGGNASKAPNDQAYGVESWGLLRDWIKDGVNAYSAWNMVLDTVGRSLDTVRPWAQNALLAVDTSSKKLIITPTYYVFRHLSQYVDPGAKLVGTSGGDALAFKNPDGSIVTVMFNSGGAKTAIVAVGGKKLQFSMPGNGWATINYP